MIEYTCEICDNKFDEKEYEYTNDNTKCILHCTKNIKYDHRGSIVHSKFSHSLLEYTIKDIDFTIYIDDCIKIFLDRKNIKHIINDLNEFLKINLKEIFNNNDLLIITNIQKKDVNSANAHNGSSLFKDNKITITDLLNNYREVIGNSIKNIYLDMLNGKPVKFGLESVFNSKTNRINIYFREIHFPCYKTRDHTNYIKILEKLDSIYLDECTFYDEKLDLENIQCYFDNCEFKDGLVINNLKILNNPNSVLFQNCKFFNNVSFPIEKNIIDSNLFCDCEFKKDIIATKIIFNGKVFNNTEKNKYKKINSIKFEYCIFKDNFLINDTNREIDEKFEINDLNLKESTFEKKVKIQFCDIEYISNFYNTKFNDLADFYQTKFKIVDFRRTDFKDICVFSESEFNCDVDFKYTKFLGNSIFRDTVITGNLNLRDSIFNNEANFLDITSKSRKKYSKEKNEYEIIGEATDIKVANRETARIIKHQFEKLGNKIEANKYHALELEQKRRELEKDKWGNWKEYIVFKLHNLSSEHSTNWLFVLLWILVIGFLSTALLSTSLIIFPYILLLSISFLASNKYIYSLMVSIIGFGIIAFFDSSFCLKNLTNNISLIHLMHSEFIFIGIEKDKLTTWQSVVIFFNKVSLGYLYYQFLMSVRKDTRK